MEEGLKHYPYLASAGTSFSARRYSIDFKMKSVIQVITNSVDLRFKQRLIIGRESGRDFLKSGGIIIKLVKNLSK
jgi:hypothetical protein